MFKLRKAHWSNRQFFCDLLGTHCHWNLGRERLVSSRLNEVDRMRYLAMRNVDLHKTLTYLFIHLAIGFTVAYLFTGSVALAGGIALVEPCVNAVAFYFHEKVWKRVMARRNGANMRRIDVQPA